MKFMNFLKVNVTDQENVLDFLLQRRNFNITEYGIIKFKVMIISKRIQESSHYKSLNHIQQKLLLKKNNVETIRHGHKMSLLTSFDNWVSKFSPAHNIKMIVKDLI